MIAISKSRGGKTTDEGTSDPCMVGTQGRKNREVESNLKMFAPGKVSISISQVDRKGK